MIESSEKSHPTVPITVAAVVHLARRLCQRGLAAQVQAFAKCRRGGAMLLAGALGTVVLTSLGAMMGNYAWREAQSEELQAALRAAVSSVGSMLTQITDPVVKERVKVRVASFLGGLTPGLEISADDVTVTYDTDTNITRVSIGGNAKYQYTDLWSDKDNADDASDVQLPTHTVAVIVDFNHYEVAIAADITGSMGYRIEMSEPLTRIDAMKSAIDIAIDIMEDVSEKNSGGLTISLVPFGSSVNVGDTGGSGETAGKKRYAHMLGGAPHGDASAATSAHWVDLYHHYGSSGTWGTDLQTRTLPIFASTTSWNLRGTVDIDLSDETEAPGVGTWSVERKDFWNGCVMARWGAYWDSAARPSACAAGCQRQCSDNDLTCSQCATGCWHADMSRNASLWPARMNVKAWTASSTALTAEPLHLSDAPPDAAHPSTRFTAYSWPDARVSATSDARLLGVLLETLDPGSLEVERVKYAQGGDNDWSFSNTSQQGGRIGAGDWYCPSSSPIIPLSEDVAALRTASREMPTINAYHKGGTYTHLGVVWGLRTLSPLWKDVWGAKDDRGVKRPLTPCAPNETGTHCTPLVKKTILLISDGGNTIGNTQTNLFKRGRINYTSQYEILPENPIPLDSAEADAHEKLCSHFTNKSALFQNATNEIWENNFNARFTDLNGNGHFADNSLNRLVSAFETAMETTLSAASRRALRDRMTPWELFRNHGFLNDGTNFTDTLLTASNGFDFDGRPVFDDMACRLTSHFASYGRIGDLMQAGGKPVVGVAPFANVTGTSHQALNDNAKPLLDGWLLDACRIAKERNVQIKIIFIGPSASPHLELLRQCIDAADGNRNTDLYATPTAEALTSAFRDVFTITRNLRFLD